MIAKPIIFFGNSLVLICDARCKKAWGNSSRPKIQLSDDPDDVEWVADDEFATAPENPGTYEGNDAKPCVKSERLNRWCARECERSEMVKAGEDFQLPDWSKRRRNIPVENGHTGATS